MGPTQIAKFHLAITQYTDPAQKHFLSNCYHIRKYNVQILKVLVNGTIKKKVKKKKYGECSKRQNPEKKRPT